MRQECRGHLLNLAGPSMRQLQPELHDGGAYVACQASPRSSVAHPIQAALRHHYGVRLRPGLTIEDTFLDRFAKRWGIIRLALYGSVLRDDFGPSSDIDMLVEFLPDRIPGLLRLAQMELELEAVLGRQVELRTYEDLSPYFRDDVVATARPLYAA